MDKTPPTDSAELLFADRFAQIRRQFHAGLVARLQDIDSATEPQMRYAHLHRLVGAAGAYGDTALAAAARMALEAAASAEHAEALEQAMQAVRAEVARLVVESGHS